MLNIPKLAHVVVIVAALFTTGCASIVSGSRQEVYVRSVPEGAKATFYDKKGNEVSSQLTPCVADLKRSSTYVLKIEKEAYKPMELKIKQGLNGWYFGNILFGGLIGMIIVDPITGAMMTLNPDQVAVELASVRSKAPSIVTEATRN